MLSKNDILSKKIEELINLRQSLHSLWFDFNSIDDFILPNVTTADDDLFSNHLIVSDGVRILFRKLSDSLNTCIQNIDTISSSEL